tara:strand:+ start:648 stop:824 length:177 start_codon:yes stop_codon:yes gene_type:complete
MIIDIFSEKKLSIFFSIFYLFGLLKLSNIKKIIKDKNISNKETALITITPVGANSFDI